MCDFNHVVAQLINNLSPLFSLIKLEGGTTLADNANIVYLKVTKDFPENASEDIISFKSGEYEYYGLRYEYPYSKNNKNIFLVKLNVNEYRDDGEYLQLSKGDVFEVRYENNSIFISLKGNEQEFCIPSDSKKISFLQFQQSEYLEQSTEKEYKKFNKTYQNFSSSSKSSSESESDVENIETVSSSTDETNTESTENNELNSETFAETTTTEVSVSEQPPINNFFNVRSLITIGIIAVFIITTIFLLCKLKKAKLYKKKKKKFHSNNITSYRYTIDNKTSSNIKNMLAYPVTYYYNLKNEYEADLKNNSGALLFKTNGLDFRYSVQNQPDKLIVQPLNNSFSSEKNILDTIQNLGKFILSYSKEYKLVICELNVSLKSICIIELQDYSKKNDTTIKDLADIMNKFLSSKDNIPLTEQNPDNSPLQSMIEFLTYITEVAYKPIQYSETYNHVNFIKNFIDDFNKISTNKNILPICKDGEIYQNIKLTIAICIEVITIAKNKSFFNDILVQKEILFRLRETMSLLEKQLSLTSISKQNTTNETIPNTNNNHTSYTETTKEVINQSSEPAVAQNDDITPPEETVNIMDMYSNTSEFLASQSNKRYFSPSKDVTTFKCEIYKIVNVRFDEYGDFLIMENDLYLNPLKYTNALIEKATIENLMLNIIFNIINPPINDTKVKFKFIKPAKVNIVDNELSVLEKGEIQF